MITKTLGAILFLAGWTIGIFSLIVPLAVSIAGFIPGVVVTLLVWLISYAIALLYLEAVLSLPDGANFLSITEKYLGKPVKWIGGALFFFFLSYPLSSFFIALSSFIHSHLLMAGIEIPPPLLTLLIFLILGIIVFWGLIPTLIFNALLMIGLIASLLFIFLKSSPLIDESKLSVTNWTLTFYAFPILFGAYSFQCLIPTLSTFLSRNRKLLHIALLVGMLIPFLTYVFLEWIVKTSFPEEDLWQAFEQAGTTGVFFLFEKMPALSPYFNAFYLFAITTSILGYGYTLLDFFADGKKMPPSERTGWKRGLLIIVSLLPALLFSLTVTHLYNETMNAFLGFIQILLSFFPLLAVWMIRYQLAVPLKPLLSGGKFMLILLFLVTFLSLWLQSISLIQ